jgi:hypothetical protein
MSRRRRVFEDPPEPELDELDEDDEDEEEPVEYFVLDEEEDWVFTSVPN